ncbi:MAG: CotH kinase family protein, partial [Candidatus Omnitrophica bacterium]|nr:CotH kinase family protein [Candidatus Omnitrophota bacterium]
PENNWVAYRRKAPGEKFRFLVWDAEGTWGYDGQGPNYNQFTQSLNRLRPTDNEIPNLFLAMRNNPIFRELFRQRVEFHLFNGGALAEESIQLRYDELAATMSPVIDNFDMLPRNDINDLNDDFSINNIYLPLRRDFFFMQLVQEDLFDPLPTETPTVDPSATTTPTPDPNAVTATPSPCDVGYYVLDSLGGRHRVGNPIEITGPLYFGVDMARDLEQAIATIGDATAPDLVVLDSAGAAHFIQYPSANIPQMFYFGDSLQEFPQGRAIDLELSDDNQGLWVLTDFGGIFRAGSSIPSGEEEQVPGTENINTLGWDVPLTGDMRNSGMPDPGGATLRAVSFVVFDVDENSQADGYIILDSQGGRLHLDPDGEEILPGTFPGFPINHPYRLLDPEGYAWPFFPGLDIARDMELYQTEEGVVIFDGWGGIHPVPVDIESNAVYFATNRVSNANPVPAQSVGMPYFVTGFDDPSTPEIDESISNPEDPDSTGFDVASIFTDLEFSHCAGGLYTLDKFGGVFALGTARGDDEVVSAPFTGSPYFFPAQLAESLEIFNVSETEFETDFR